jgi:hypothetical protein
MAREDAATTGDADGPGALAFVHDRGVLARRFLLAELLAPPLALRRRGGRGALGSPTPQSRDAVKPANPEAPPGGGRR